LLGPNNSFTAVIKLITNALEHQSHEISAQYHQEKINSLKYIGNIFDECHGRITHYALRKAQNNFTETARIDKNSGCNGNHHIRTGIPCRHQILAVIDSGGKIKPSDFHAQWHINVSFFFFISFHFSLSLFFFLYLFFFLLFMGWWWLGVVGMFIFGAWVWESLV